MAPLNKGKTLYFYDGSTDHFWKDVITFKRKSFVFFDNYQPGPNREVREGVSKSFSVNIDGIEDGLVYEKKLNIFNDRCAAIYKTSKDIEWKKMWTWNVGMNNHIYVCLNKKKLLAFAIKHKDEFINEAKREIPTLKNSLGEVDIDNVTGIADEIRIKARFNRVLETIEVYENAIKEINGKAEMI